MGSKFTAILWDVDGTLLDFLYSQRVAITKCFRSVGREITEEQIARYSQINDAYWRRLELGEVTKEQLLTGRFTTLFDEYGIAYERSAGVSGGTGTNNGSAENTAENAVAGKISVEAFVREYQEALGSVFSYLDDSLTVCRTLRERAKIKQYVVTNGVSRTQRNKLKLSGFDEIMEELFISEEIGVPKPQKLFFDYCLSHMEEKDRTKILLVGDSLTSDIKGGVQSGIATCWYRPEGKRNDTPYQADYEISDLHKLYDVLEV